MLPKFPLSCLLKHWADSDIQTLKKDFFCQEAQPQYLLDVSLSGKWWENLEPLIFTQPSD